jgi:NAD(P)-dependent dehydrogenase (short-subunit alcohol dehydrogenase family)
MPDNQLLISTGSLIRQSLANQAAVVSGAGGGIGFEAARALCWLGARVVIAELDQPKGNKAVEQIQKEFGPGSVCFIHTDIGDEDSVQHMARQAVQTFGKIDIVINNATITPMGAVNDLPIENWDRSYRVNLRGPVLLARTFLPGMLERDHGVFVCISSVGGAYMSAYETFKSAQVELARALDGELEGTNVIAFTIGPGIVRTETAQASISKIAHYYGKTPEEFFAMYQDHLISAEAAGAGFAAAVAQAPRFRGLEIGAKQALLTAGIDLDSRLVSSEKAKLSEEQIAQALALTRDVRAALVGQVDGWHKRSLFERQWMLRDFKTHAGMPANDWLKILAELEHILEIRDTAQLTGLNPPIKQLAQYFKHYLDLARSNIKDQNVLSEQTQIIIGWIEATERLAALLAGETI